MTAIITTVVIIIIMVINANRHHGKSGKIRWIIPVIIRRIIGNIGRRIDILHDRS
jgi:hypothetical protein